MLVARLKNTYQFSIFSTRYQDFVKDEDRIVIEPDETQSVYGDYLDFQELDLELVEETEPQATDSLYTREQVEAMTAAQLRNVAMKLELPLKSQMGKPELFNLVIDALKLGE